MKWYQPIKFPDGATKGEGFDKDSFGEREWDKIIKPNLPDGESFLDIGCNSGLHLVLANFKKKYGIERHQDYYKQCLYVLNEFGVKAKITDRDVLDIELPQVDVTLMSKSLHWIGYSDDGEFIEDYENVVDGFLCKLSEKTKHLLIVGADHYQDRIGGSLEKTLPFVEKHFKIIKAEKIKVDRPLNIIVCKTF